MDFKKIAKVLAVISAICALAAAVYFAIKKLGGKKKPEYFDDNDFFECDNDIEVVEVKDDAPAEKEEKAKEAPKEKAEETKKAAPKKAAPKKAAAKKAAPKKAEKAAE